MRQKLLLRHTWHFPLCLVMFLNFALLFPYLSHLGRCLIAESLRLLTLLRLTSDLGLHFVRRDS